MTRAKLGQHFMVSDGLAEWIVKQLEAKKEEKVLEIGPGRGALTKHIDADLTCIELDKSLAPFLEGYDVIWGDALEVEWPPFDRIISNLPYQISSGVFAKLVGMDFKKGIFALQKEFAEKLVGKSKRSRLTAMADFAFETKILKTLGRGSTRPAPKVKMAIVSVRPRKLPKNWEKIKKLIDALFIHPRKTVRSALRDGGIEAPDNALADKRVRKLDKNELSSLAEMVFG